jgi:RimJ/RimL family protein N-acetyltransferase
MASRAPARLVYRKLWELDLPHYLDHLRRLAPDDRRARFTREIHDEQLIAYAAGLDPRRTILTGCFADGVLRGVAELHLGDHRRLDEAEAAFSVEPPFQNRGIASELMERLLVTARNRGVRRIWLVCLTENSRIRRIARKLGAAVQVDQGEAVAALRPLPAHPATMLAEAWDDSQQLARVATDFGRTMAAAARPWFGLAA